MYRYLSCFIVLVVTTAALAQNPIPRQGKSCPGRMGRSVLLAGISRVGIV
jgi:hypothetical protein